MGGGGGIGGLAKNAFNTATLGMFDKGGGGGGPGYDSGGIQPVRPAWDSELDPTTGLLKNQYQTQWGSDVTPDMGGMDAYRKMALGTGPTDQAKAQLVQQQLEEAGLKNQTQQQAGSAEAQARSALASKYGLSSGAQASLAKQNMKNQMSGLQNVGFQGASQRATIGANDAATRNNFLSGLPGQENALAQIGLQNKQGNLQNQQFNVTNAMNEVNAKRQADLATYQSQMQQYGANKTADAMQNSGSGGKK